MPLFSLDHYFKRIHFGGNTEPTMSTVTEIMRCQLFSVPFENLDVQARKTISIDPEDIVAKIVGRQRGGYCYEVNGLLSMALDALRIPYFFIAARPLLTHGAKKPRLHMAIVVQLDGEQWLCDCGFGAHGIRTPIRLSLLDTEVNQDGELFMLSLNEDQEYVLKTVVHHHWEAQYAFTLARQSWIDFVPANYYNSTHPNSLFVQKLIVVICTRMGRKILFGNTLKIIHQGHEIKQFLTQENRASILREEFGLEE